MFLAIRCDRTLMQNDSTGEMWIRITPRLVKTTTDSQEISGPAFDFPIDMEAFRKREDEASQALMNSLQKCLARMVMNS